MGKKSEYNENLRSKQYAKFKELQNKLPPYVHPYLNSLVVDYQMNTLIAYTRDLITFFEYLQEMNPILKCIDISQISELILEELKPQDIIEYRNYLSDNIGLHKHSNQASSINRRMAPLRGFFADACDNQILKNNPTLLQNNRRKKRKDKKEIVYMENNEVGNFIHVIENSMMTSSKQRKFCLKTQLRDLAIIILLLHTGIRVSECVGIDIEDLDFNNKSVRVTRKGGFESTIYFSEVVASALSDYIKMERPKFISFEEEKALFLSSQKKRMSVRSIQELVKKYAREAVPGKKISPHKLRSTYGTALYDQTRDIRLVADVLGHEDISTTARHYAAMKKKHMQQAAKVNPYE